MRRLVLTVGLVLLVVLAILASYRARFERVSGEEFWDRSGSSRFQGIAIEEDVVHLVPILGIPKDHYWADLQEILDHAPEADPEVIESEAPSRRPRRLWQVARIHGDLKDWRDVPLVPRTLARDALAARAVLATRASLRFELVYLPLLVVVLVWGLPVAWRVCRRRWTVRRTATCTAVILHYVLIFPYLFELAPWWRAPAPGGGILGGDLISLVTHPFFSVLHLIHSLPSGVRPLATPLLSRLPLDQVPWDTSWAAGLLGLANTALWAGLAYLGGLLVEARRRVGQEREVEGATSA